MPLTALCRTRSALASAPPAPRSCGLAGARAGRWLVVLVVYVGCMVWTERISFTSSRMLPSSISSGCGNTAACSPTSAGRSRSEHRRLRRACSSSRSLVLGFLLAVLIDQRVRAKNLLRTIFLYPFAMSFVVTGLVWQWLLNPTFGIAEAGARPRASTASRFDWIVQPGHGDLHARHRRRLAGGRAWSWRSCWPACAASTRTSGRRRGSTASRPGGSTSRSSCRCCAAMLRHRRRAARDQRGAALRPRRRDDQWRPGHRLRGAGQVRHGPPVRAQQYRPRHRRRDVDAGHRRRRSSRPGSTGSTPAPARGARHDAQPPSSRSGRAPAPADARHASASMPSWSIAALFFLLPLYVMVVTSLKAMAGDPARQHLRAAAAPTLRAWVKAWSSACTGLTATASASASGTRCGSWSLA